MPGLDWSTLFQAVQSQGKSPGAADPKSPTDVYVAYLDKADLDTTDDAWYLMFDMMPVEAAVLGFDGPTGDGMRPPTLPTIIFHATAATPAAVAAALQLSSGEEPAEGSWYVLYLQPGGNANTQVVGQLYHPNTDFIPASPNYGTWYIEAAQLMSLPGPPKAGRSMFIRPPASRRGAGPVGAVSKPRTFQRATKINKRKFDLFQPRQKFVVLKLRGFRVRPPPPPPPPGYGALGVMAIGQGGFNLFFDRGTLEPVFYYDVGYPLGFFLASVPPAMQVGGAGFQGPIFQNAANNLSVVLSHWDWDHWRFGAFANAAGHSLGLLPWTIPAQPMGPTATNFCNNVLNAPVTVPIGAPPQGGPNGSTMYKLQPPPGAPPAVVINNSGLVLRVPVDIAGAPSAPVVLTGDGNFGLLPGGAVAGVRVIGAVHHGSGNHGAAANLPAPAGIIGYIAYSYGINPANGNHAYHFPHPAAVAAYRAANWTAPTEQGTAEGANINVGPPAAGNVRVGNQGALPAAYGGTAFAAIGHALP